jgi:hypothetical protein
MEVSVGSGLTVRTVLPLMPVNAAETGAVPAETPVANPAELIVATTVLEETHVT